MADFTAQMSANQYAHGYEDGYASALRYVRLFLVDLRNTDSEEGRQFVEDWLTQEIIDEQNH
jgi:uncharacterized membrane protein YcjF (UPF0283 family)